MIFSLDNGSVQISCQAIILTKDAKFPDVYIDGQAEKYVIFLASVVWIGSLWYLPGF